MSATAIILSVVFLLIASLALSAFIYTRQQSLAKRRTKVMFYKQQADEMLGYLALLLALDPNYELILLLQKRVIHMTRNASELIPQDAMLRDTLRKHQHNLTKYEKHQRDNDLTLYLLSDAELNQAQSQLTQLSKLLDMFCAQALITHDDVDRLKQHVRELRLNLEVCSHLEQANRYAQAKDFVMYQMHVKHAREALRKTSIEVAGKEKKIDHLSEALRLVKESHELTLFNEKAG